MKRSDHLRPLSLNHYDGLIAARRLQLGIEKKADADIMREYILALWEKHLVSHFLQEEEHLLPELNRLGVAVMKDRLMNDHLEMATIADSLQEEDNPLPQVKQFSHLLNRHIRFEERALFPYLERQLGDERLSRIGRYLHEAHEEGNHDWSPAFWR